MSHSLKDYYEARRVAYQHLMVMPMSHPDYVETRDKLIRASRAIDSMAIRIGYITGTIKSKGYPYRKLPRKAKKRYIKQHGRAVYHAKYHKLNLDLYISTL